MTVCTHLRLFPLHLHHVVFGLQLIELLRGSTSQTSVSTRLPQRHGTHRHEGRTTYRFAGFWNTAFCKAPLRRMLTIGFGIACGWRMNCAA